MRQRVIAALVAGACAQGCDEPPAEPEGELRFQAPVQVWQAPAEALRSVWLADAGGGRVFGVAGALLPDGREGAYVMERVGDTWSAPFAWPRPTGTTVERVAWVGAWPSPAVVSIASGPVGDVVAVRTFAGTEWSSPIPLTVAGAERPVIARLAEGNPRARTLGTTAPFDVVYGVASTACPEGVELRHRRSDRRALLAPGDLPTWGAARTVAFTCGVSSLSAATDGSALAVAWTGAGLGLSTAGARDLFAAYGTADGDAVRFGAATLLQRGANRDVSAASLGEGAFLLGWAQRSMAADGTETGLQRAAWARFDPLAMAWTDVDTGWFFTRTSPLVRGDGTDTALALGSDGDFPTSPLVVRRWRASRPVSSRSVAGLPQGAVSSMSFLRMDDGSVEVVWVEALPQGGGARVMWTRGVRVVSRDAGV